ncbi:serine/threonine-protein kinase [Nocardia lasii]|uniref:non-specific serine/threonine protein kinase n=1 Tax=Nocardia lasii TaxID=1616107 RepID=A0ABW1JNQ4_9NOCA
MSGPLTDRFGDYRLDRRLGAGAMGEVWLAFDTANDRAVALKVLPATLSRDPVYRTRFDREATAAASVHHPHVVAILAHGAIEGRLYIAMDPIDGTDLATRLTQGPLPVAQAVGIVAQIADALDAVHDAGLVHRDVKPSNIMIDADGVARLIDFGIAWREDQTSLTATGATVGTWAYMAPERFSGTVSRLSDVYSLACVLYECLTARRPFGDADPARQMHAQLTAPPPRARQVVRTVPRALDAVIADGMAKDPSGRPHSAGALARAAQDATRPRAVRTGLLVGAAVLVLVAGLATAHTLRPAEGSTHPDAAPTRSQPETTVPKPAAKFAATATIPVNSAPRGIAVDSVTGSTYIVGSDSLAVLDARRTLARTIPLSGRPRDVTVDAAAGKVFVGDIDGGVHIVDTRTDTVLGTVATGGYSVGVAADPVARRAYVTDLGDDTVGVIDSTTNTLSGTIHGIRSPVGIAAYPSGNTLYVTNQSHRTVSVIDTRTDAITATIPVGAEPIAIAVDESKGVVYVVNYSSESVSVIDTTTNTVTATVKVGYAPQAVAVDAARGLVYVAQYTTVTVIDAFDNTRVASVPVGTSTSGPGIAVDASTHEVLVTNEDDDTVTLISANPR